MALMVLYARADILSHVMDVISTSAPDTEATHAIRFTATTDIPASGHISIDLPLSFTVPASFDYTDVDLQVSSDGGTTFVDRDLASVADATNDGVTVTSATSTDIDLELNSSSGISAGDVVQILLGTNATFGNVGTDDIVNPLDPGSYRVGFVTTDSSGTEIDHGSTIDVVILPVTLQAAIPIVAPVRSNGLPSGLIAANNFNIELSLETDILAHCRYATSTGVLYEDMTNDFNPDFGTTFWVNTTGYQNDTTYTFYVRCVAFASGFANDDDYPITFTLKPTPISNTSATSTGEITNGPTGNLGNGGAGDFPNGSDVLYLSSVTFIGTSIPGSTITGLQDGIKTETTQAKADGTFSLVIDKLERGAYGFELYTQDGRALTSSLYGTTLSVAQGTDNAVTGITIPPTIQLSADNVSPGDSESVSGGAPPNAIVQVSVAPQLGSTTQAAIKTYTASSSQNGDWSVKLDTSSLSKGVYTVQATAAISTSTKSSPSKHVTFSIGGVTNASCGTPDMNSDGKVNLIDFSIFLLSWQSTDAKADFNCDGAVNLGDFSIMLFNWTG